MQLETFKRSLMQSLQEDDESPGVSFLFVSSGLGRGKEFVSPVCWKVVHV